MLKEKIFSILSVVIVVSMLTMLLTGCGSKTDSSGDSDTASAVSAVNTSSIEETDLFTSRDQDPSYDDATSTHITFDDRHMVLSVQLVHKAHDPEMTVMGLFK